jgi:hypothetical protein
MVTWAATFSASSSSRRVNTFFAFHHAK